MLKVAWIAYGIIALAMIATTIVTGRRATALSGEPHYFATVTTIFVEEKVKPKDATDAAFDTAFEDEDEATELRVPKDVFVLGLLDATAPTIIGGACLLAGISFVVKRLRRRPAEVGKQLREDV